MNLAISSKGAMLEKTTTTAYYLATPLISVIFGSEIMDSLIEQIWCHKLYFVIKVIWEQVKNA